jgi:hypothetical protein
MTRRYAQLFSVASILLLVLSIAAFARFSSPAQQTATQTQVAIDPALKEIANYRQWTRVNEKPKHSNNFLIDLPGG